MKAELIEKFTSVLQAEDIMSVRDQVRTIRGEWKSETTKEKHIQLEEFRAANAENPDAEFTYTPHELEGKFQELLNQAETHSPLLEHLA